MVGGFFWQHQAQYDLSFQWYFMLRFMVDWFWTKGFLTFSTVEEEIYYLRNDLPDAEGSIAEPNSSAQSVMIFITDLVPRIVFISCFCHLSHILYVSTEKMFYARKRILFFFSPKHKQGVYGSGSESKLKTSLTWQQKGGKKDFIFGVSLPLLSCGRFRDRQKVPMNREPRIKSRLNTMGNFYAKRKGEKVYSSSSIGFAS